jgi:hypothetical protein
MGEGRDYPRHRGHAARLPLSILPLHSPTTPHLQVAVPTVILTYGLHLGRASRLCSLIMARLQVAGPAGANTRRSRLGRARTQLPGKGPQEVLGPPRIGSSMRSPPLDPAPVGLQPHSQGILLPALMMATLSEFPGLAVVVVWVHHRVEAVQHTRWLGRFMRNRRKLKGSIHPCNPCDIHGQPHIKTVFL